MRRHREQTGSLYKRAGMWVLRYRQTVNVGGQLKTIQKAVQLAPVTSYKTKRSLDSLIKEKLAAVNTGNRSPERVTLLGEFVETAYLPYVKEHKRPSTYKGYRDMWEDHLKARCADALLRDVKTYDVQRWLEQIAKQDGLSKASMKHNKHFLSGVFRFAAQQDYFDCARANPVQLASVPDAPSTTDTYAYSLDEVKNMLARVPEPAATVIAVAALAGLRRGEIRGLEWSDYTPAENGKTATLQIRRSIWNGISTDPKTEKSKAPIPVIGPLAKMLDAHRLRAGNLTSGPIFRNSLGKPMDLDGIYRHVIKEVNGIEWHGWHGFRRGLASNLNRLGVDDSVIQGILRHSSVAVTQGHYIKTTRTDAVAAMQQLENALMFADCAPEKPETGDFTVN